jgi:hypothetical protein
MPCNRLRVLATAESDGSESTEEPGRIIDSITIIYMDIDTLRGFSLEGP